MLNIMLSSKLTGYVKYYVKFNVNWLPTSLSLDKSQQHFEKDVSSLQRPHWNKLRVYSALEAYIDKPLVNRRV